MSIARTIDGLEGAILIDANGAAVIGSGGGGGGGGSTSVWSSSDAAANAMTLSNGGLTVAGSGAASYETIRSSISKTSGMLYVEFLNSGTNSSINVLWGLANAGFATGSGHAIGDVPISGGTQPGVTYGNGGGFVEHYFMPNLGVSLNDVIAMAVDFGAGNVWVAQNNVWINGSNPATGSLPVLSFTPASAGALFAAISLYGAGAQWTLQSTAASQKYAPPSGFSAWDGGVAPPPTSVWSSSDATANGMTLSNGGLTVTSAVSGAYKSVRGSIGNSSGKVYVEFLANAVMAVGYDMFGAASSSFDSTKGLGSNPISFGLQQGASYDSSAYFGFNYSYSSYPATNDVWALAIDFTAGLIWIAQNNVWVNSSNPATGSLPIAHFVAGRTVGSLFPALTFYQAGESWTLQSTAANQKYAPPSGFSVWDSAAPVVTGHRYWRVYMTQIGGGNAYSFAEIQFRTQAGTPLLFSGGTASASTTYSGYPASNATDNDISTLWSAVAANPTDWWEYDYGTGNAKTIVEITIQARIGSPDDAPSVFTPQWSDDGGNWIPMGTITAAPWTTDFQIQTFPVQTPSQAYLARTVGGNEGGNGANIAALIDGLVSDGVWAKLDALYVLAQQNQSDALLNLVGTSYTITAIGPPIFTAYVGFSQFAASQYLDTTFSASAATSPNYTANNASYGVWSYAVVQENYAVMGNGATGASDSIMYPSFPPTSFYARVNDNTATYVNAPGAKGLFVGDRPSSTVVNPYWNGLSQGTISSTSAGVTNATFTIGQSQGYLGQDDPAPRIGTAQTLSAAFIGASLGAAGQLALYNRLRTYMTAVGVP